MMYHSKIFLQFIVILLSLGYVVSKAGVEENRNIFSAELDIVRPWDECKELNDTHTLCGEDLFGEDVELENQGDMRYVMKVQIGTSKQEFKVKIDTGSHILWVFDKECKDEDPLCKNHNKYDSSKSNDKTQVDNTFEMKYGKGEVEGLTFKDTVYLTASIEIEKQIFGAVTKTTTPREGYDGILGLGKTKFKGEYSPFFHAVADKTIDKPIFGVFIQNSGKKGEITFGGINEAHLKKETAVSAKIEAGVHVAIKMKKLMLGDTEACNENDASCKAIIDTGCSAIMGPKDVVGKFLKEKLDTDDKKGYEVKCDSIAGFPNLVVTLGEKTLTLEASYYTLKFNNRCYSLLRPFDFWLLGDPFLSKFYTEFDLTENKEKVTFFVAK